MGAPYACPVMLSVGDQWWDVVSEKENLGRDTIFGQTDKYWVGTPESNIWISFKLPRFQKPLNPYYIM
jgi:hypothetical protein